MNEEDIPIDIHYNKLLDWLVSRHHCNQQWQQSALVIREKISNAIQDMPEHPEIIKLLQGAYINYFHCLKIVEILKETEKATKNLFGSYSSQRMKDWQEIVKLYQQDGVYLAEVAQLLIRNVNYEIPSLKKQIAKCKQQQTDCSRKEGEYAANSAELKTKYYAQCKQMGIKGNKVKTELMALVRDLPSTFEEVSEKCKHTKDAVKHYKAFLEFTLGSEESSKECLPLLNYIINKGNTTTFEYRHGRPPTSIETVDLSFTVEDEEGIDESKADEIDFGGLDLDTEDGGIDFGEDPVDIDWGADDVQIEVVADEQGVQEVVSLDTDVAKGTEALTILDNVELRNQFINELLEISDFLDLRSEELEDTSDILSGDQFQNAPACVHLTRKETTEMLSSVNEIIELLTSNKMKDLLMIRSSPRYVDRLAEKVKKVLNDSDMLKSRSELMVIRRQEALQEEKDTEPKVDLIRQKTKELKEQISKEISKKYKGRRVNIMGEVNTM